MNKYAILLTALFAFFQNALGAEKIRVAAASDLKFAMDEIVAEYKLTNPGSEVDVVAGSSGKFFEQINAGAPFDLFFSADVDFPQKLIKAGIGEDITSYAIGRIVLWSMMYSPKSLKELTQPKYKKIAIANPMHAPYGKRAEEALKNEGVLETIKERLVFGENISQTAQFVESNAADAGVVSLSLVLAPPLKGKGHFILLSEKLHFPLVQTYIILNSKARNFASFIQTEKAKIIIKKYGFDIPKT